MTRTSATAPVEKKRPVWKPLAAAGIGGAVLVATGFGVFAQLSATAFNEQAQTVDSGTLRLSLANSAGSAGFGQVVDKLAPKDVVHRLVTVTNTGTLAGLDLTLSIKDATPTLLSTSATRGLQVAVTRCEGTWSYTGSPALPACSGTTSIALADQALSGLTNAVGINGEVLSPNGVNNLLVTLRLPDQDEVSVNNQPAVVNGGSIQALTANLTYTFTEVQRTETVTSS